MNQLKFLTTILLGLGLAAGSQAQEVIPATGGEASGDGGTASYTIGQVVCTTTTGTNGYSIAEGVQQPYEISTVTAVKEAGDINLILQAYPNPAGDYLIMKAGNIKTGPLKYLLFDSNGRLLLTVRAEGEETMISVKNLTPEIYFLKVFDGSKNLKTFKIIKK